MLRTSQPDDKEDDRQDLADQMSDVGEMVAKAIQEIRFPATKVEAKFDPRIEVNVPELKSPVVQVTVRPEAPKQNPHPFANGLLCEVVRRDYEGKIEKFTLKPIKP